MILIGLDNYGGVISEHTKDMFIKFISIMKYKKINIDKMIDKTPNYYNN